MVPNSGGQVCAGFPKASPDTRSLPLRRSLVGEWVMEVSVSAQACGVPRPRRKTVGSQTIIGESKVTLIAQRGNEMVFPTMAAGLITMPQPHFRQDLDTRAHMEHQATKTGR